MSENSVKIEFTEAAVKEIACMVDHAQLTGFKFGSGSPAHLKSTESLLHTLNNIIRLGGEVWREGQHELGGCSVGGLVYGVVKRDATSKDRNGHEVTTPEWSMHS